MGPKIDHSKSNIGYARFTHVRIPRFNMFSKLFKVTREGQFVAPPPKLGKFKNISMMEVRMMIVNGASSSLGKAATIATRYSCVRKQGFRDTTAVAGAGAPEFTIMDYRMQQCAPTPDYPCSLYLSFYWSPSPRAATTIPLGTVSSPP